MESLVSFVREPWNVLGIVGQMLFMSRFVIQWFKSEIVGRSVIPIAFWWCSLGGGLLVLTYAIHREEPVFIAGQAGGLLVYLRNLYLIYREKKQNLEGA